MNFINELMIGGSAGILIGSAIGYLMVASNKKSHRLELLSAYEDSRQTLLDSAVRETTCANALLLKIHNGGGKLVEGQNWYSSVVAEAPERSLLSAKRFWQNQQVQESYKEIIRKVQSQKKLLLRTDEMNDKDLLKGIYTRMGIIGSLVMEVYRDDYNYYYLSFPIRENIHQVSDLAEHNLYDTTTIFMQKLLRKYSNFDVLELE